MIESTAINTNKNSLSTSKALHLVSILNQKTESTDWLTIVDSRPLD